MNPDEPANAPQRWFKEDTGGERLAGREIDVGKFSGTNETDDGFPTKQKTTTSGFAKENLEETKPKIPWSMMEYHHAPFI